MTKNSGKSEKTANKRMSAPAVIALDLLCIVIGLNVFAYFHHVRDYLHPAQAAPVTLITPAPPSAAPTEKPSEPEAETETTPLPVQEKQAGMWSERFPGVFTDGEIIRTENTYKSPNISVTVTKVEKPGLFYHVAEIYVTDIRYLRTAFGEKGYGYRGMAADIASANNAVAAISGDYYSARQEGIVVRNGVLYRDTRFEDVCVLLSDGRMLTLASDEVDTEQLKAAAPWQVWSFGPRLLENGKAMTTFNSTVERRNPRSAIGYAEPGHYFFVQVDGRNANGSRGMTLEDLAVLFEELGCESAYNLDGGQTAGFVWNGALASYPYGRSVSDIIYVTDQLPEGEGE